MSHLFHYFCYVLKSEIPVDPLKNPNICGLSLCEIEDEKFRYSPKTVYKYSYESSFQTLFEGTDKNDPESELHVFAMAEITFPTKCQGQLRLNSVRLKNHYSTGVEQYDRPSHADYEYEEDDKSKEDFNETPKQENIIHPQSPFFCKEIEDFEIRFDFHDGLIQEICPSSYEPTWVTNFKRGILSALQNTMFRFDLDHESIETDVSGKCEVSYRFVGSSNTSILIMKSKDISSCQHRNKFKSIVQATPYEFRRVIAIDCFLWILNYLENDVLAERCFLVANLQFFKLLQCEYTVYSFTHLQPK